MQKNKRNTRNEKIIKYYNFLVEEKKISKSEAIIFTSKKYCLTTVHIYNILRQNMFSNLDDLNNLQK